MTYISKEKLIFLCQLKEKFRDSSSRELLYLQVEAIVQWLFDGVPGYLGFAFRSLIYKMLFKKLSGFACVQPRVTFVHTHRLTVGKNFSVNSGTYINAIGGISIGENVLIGTNVTISSGKHPIEGRHTPIIWRNNKRLPITIGDDVWIGAGVVIMPGISIASGTVVGANAVVTRDTEMYSVVAGVPARVIGTRVDDMDVDVSKG